MEIKAETGETDYRVLSSCAVHEGFPYFCGATYFDPEQEWVICAECDEHYLVRSSLLENN